jgi:hypothetical protein
MRRVLPTIAMTCLCLAAVPLQADDLTGAERLLCSSLQVTISGEDGTCKVDQPWNLNVPQFFEVDLKTGRLSTTAASGENRATTVDSIKREGGLIILQGFENGRAFSFLIAEETGLVTVAVARDGLGVTAFGACTPMPPPTDPGRE